MMSTLILDVHALSERSNIYKEEDKNNLKL